MIRTVIEVSGHTSFKPYPKSTAGRRSVPIPSWLVVLLREHVERYPLGAGDLIFANEVGGALRRTLFRTRVWRPSLVRAGLIGAITANDDGVLAEWTDAHGKRHRRQFDRETSAVRHVVREHHGGMRFHDLRHSYATWLVDDGVPPNMVQRVVGHERSSTTLDLYTQRTEDPSRILRASMMTIRRTVRRVLRCRRNALLMPICPDDERTAWLDALERASDQAVWWSG